TAGGQSYPGSGTTGDGYTWTTRLGHTIVPPRPALVPLKVQADWVPELRGITIPDVSLKVTENGKALDSRRGSLLFAHFGLSGPVALDISRTVSGPPKPSELRLECDLVPTRPEPQLDEFLRTETAAAGKKQLAGVLAEFLPRRVADQLLILAGLPID